MIVERVARLRGNVVGQAVVKSAVWVGETRAKVSSEGYLVWRCFYYGYKYETILVNAGEREKKKRTASRCRKSLMPAFQVCYLERVQNLNSCF
jgi:hypothetical protein